MKTIDQKLDGFRRTYSEKSKPLRVNFRSLCSSQRWARGSNTFTHLMHRYPAKIFQYIPRFFLGSENLAKSDEMIMDPFAGTGTVLLESITHPMFKRNCIGIEINPLARLISKVKTTPLDVVKLEAEAKRLIRRIENFRCKPNIPSFKNIDLWFSRDAQYGLSKISCCIEETENTDIRDFFLLCLSSIIRDVSLADPKIPPPVILRARNFAGNSEQEEKIKSLIEGKRRADPVQHLKAAISKNIERMRALNSIEELASMKIKAEIIWDDARDLRRCRINGSGMLDKSNTMPLEKGSVALVITSPPYINAQKYLRTTKLELLWLGLADESNLVSLDRKIIGSERIFRDEYKDLKLTNIASADANIQTIYKKDPRKAAIVSRYFSDMREVIKQVSLALRKDGNFILVIGDNKVCGKMIANHKILADIAEITGDFRVEMVLVDKIRSRGMITKRHESGGLLLDEWIIVFVRE